MSVLVALLFRTRITVFWCKGNHHIEGVTYNLTYAGTIVVEVLQESLLRLFQVWASGVNFTSPRPFPPPETVKLWKKVYCIVPTTLCVYHKLDGSAIIYTDKSPQDGISLC
jgi:hypothetical protein